jgi:O-antigen ligase
LILAQNGVTAGTLGHGAVARPNGDRLRRFAAAAGMFLLGVLVMFVIAEFAFYLGHHHHRNKGELLVGVLIASVPICVYAFFSLSEALVALPKLLQELTWWDGLWGILFVSFQTFRKRSSTESYSNPVDSAATLRILMVAFVGTILLLRLFLRKTSWLKSMMTGIPGILLWFTLTTMLSTVWSVYWQWTLYKACEYSVDLATLAVIVYVARNSEELKTWFEWTWLMYGLLLCILWSWVVIDPADALSNKLEYGTQGIGIIGVQLQGVFPDVSSNDIGQYGGVIAAVGLARLLPMSRQRRNTIWYSAVFLFGCATMILAQCRSAIMGFALAVFLIYLLSRRVVQGAVIAISGFLVFLASGFGELTLEYMKRGQSSAQLFSLSSRLSWWAVAWEKFTDHPLTGLGAWAAGRFGVLAKLGHKMTASMHSDWLEIIVGTGIWGIIPILIVMIWTWWILVRFIRDPQIYGIDADLCLEAIGVLSVLTIRMFFMTELSWHAPLSFFVPIGYAEYIRRRAKYGGATSPKLLFRW